MITVYEGPCIRRSAYTKVRSTVHTVLVVIVVAVVGAGGGSNGFPVVFLLEIVVPVVVFQMCCFC